MTQDERFRHLSGGCSVAVMPLCIVSISDCLDAQYAAGTDYNASVFCAYLWSRSTMDEPKFKTQHKTKCRQRSLEPSSQLPPYSLAQPTELSSGKP